MSYPAAAAACVLAVGALWAAAGKKQIPPAKTALLCCCAALGGFLLAKAGYLCFYAREQWMRWGIRALVLCRTGTFSFAGGMAGAVAGLALGARWTRVRLADTLDGFAPWGALLTAAFRLLEYLLGTVGAGTMLAEGHWAAGTILAVRNAWGEWFWAVCLWEAAYALAVMALSFRRGRWYGTLAALCAGQVFFEVLRSNTISWHFIRLDQLWCAAILLAMALREAIACPEGGLVRRGGRVLLAAAMIGLNAWAQFVLDKPYLLTDLLPASAREAVLAHLRPVCLGMAALSAVGLGLSVIRQRGYTRRP